MQNKAGKIAEAIRALRAFEGDTQESFAKSLGISLNSVSKYEGGAPPKLGVLRKLSLHAVEVDAYELADFFEKELTLRADPLVKRALKAHHSTDVMEATSALIKDAWKSWKDLQSHVSPAGNRDYEEMGESLKMLALMLIPGGSKELK